MFDSTPLILATNDDVPIGRQAPGNSEITTQEGTGEPGAAETPGRAQGDSMWPLMMIMLAALLLIMIFSGRSQRAERKKREAMLTALKKGDRVQTIGGILGTIVEVRDHDVLLKVDENANTRIRFARTGIQAVVEQKES